MAVCRRLAHLPRTVGRLFRWPVVRIAFHKNGRPRGWLRGLGFQSGAGQTVKTVGRISSEQSLLGGQSATGTLGEGTLLVGQRAPSVFHENAPPAPARRVAFDTQKKTILVVSHEASRTGAPILALNLVQQFSERYNVIGLILGGGELIDHFRTGERISSMWPTAST